MTAPDRQDRDEIIAYIAAAAALQGLALATEWRPGVLASFEAIANADRLLSSLSLDDVEPAPRFEP